jgi:hypothetical protein
LEHRILLPILITHKERTIACYSEKNSFIPRIL